MWKPCRIEGYEDEWYFRGFDVDGLAIVEKQMEAPRVIDPSKITFIEKIKPNKDNMSSTCDFKYEEYWKAANIHGSMSQDVWMKWFNEHCGKCVHMNEICMYGEERLEGEK